MKRLILLAGYLLGPFVAACTGHQPAPGTTPYYLSRPAHTVKSEWTDPVVVFIDDRTQVWINGIEINARANHYERGGCGRIAKKVGDGFYVDSILSPIGDVILTPNSARFGCLPTQAPIHWHPIIDEGQCDLSPDDVSADKAVFPFLLEVCGFGVDSVIAYKVKPDPVVVGKSHGQGK